MPSSSYVSQIPLDFFAPEPQGLANFVIGHNAEPLTALAQLASQIVYEKTLVLWGGPSVGKTHLANALAHEYHRLDRHALLLNPSTAFPDDPFQNVELIVVDNADALNAEQQSWLFTAFNHMTQIGGSVVATGNTPPLTWSLRDDIRTRLGSGLVFEIRSIPPDELPAALAEYAEKRSLHVSNEVLTYLLSHYRRDIYSLCQALRNLDRLSLAQKKPVTIPLLRAYLALNTS